MKVLLSRSARHGALTFIVLFYIMLPYLDKKFWHAFVPEHEHWLVSKEQGNLKNTWPPTQPEPDCTACNHDAATLALSGETVVHAFSPTFGLQFFTILISLCGLFILTLPRTLSFRLATTPLLLKSAVLIPPEPPPNAV